MCPCHHGSLDLWEHPPRVQMALVLVWTFTFTLGAGKAQTASQMWISRPWKSNIFSQNPDKKTVSHFFFPTFLQDLEPES